jgi:hypothetical protein
LGPLSCSKAIATIPRSTAAAAWLARLARG